MTEIVKVTHNIFLLFSQEMSNFISKQHLNMNKSTCDEIYLSFIQLRRVSADCTRCVNQFRGLNRKSNWFSICGKCQGQDSIQIENPSHNVQIQAARNVYP